MSGKDAPLAVGLLATQLLLCVGPAAWCQAPTKRDAVRTHLFDNAKFVCEVLVVFSHFALFLDRVPTGGSELMWPRKFRDATSHDLAWPQIVYESTMIYRIPVFAFMCGLFAKGELNTVRMERLLTYTVAPLLLYLGGPAGYLLGCGRLDLNLFMTDKIDGLWFMGAVIVWRLSSQLLRPFSRLGVVLIGVAVSALAPSVFEQGPYNADNIFAYKMALTFFFAFAIGLAADVRAPHLAAVDSWTLRGACMLLLLLPTLAFASPALVVLFDDHVTNLYTMDDAFTPTLYAYLSLPVGSVENPNAERIRILYGAAWAWLPRLTSMALALVFGGAFLAALPQGRTWYTAAGGHNNYAYLLHCIALAPLHNLAESALHLHKLSREPGSARYLVDPAHDLVWWPYLTLAPVLLTLGLSTRPVRLLTWPIVEPTWIKLLFAGGYERYLADGGAKLHMLAPAHLGLNSPQSFARWAKCEAVVVGGIAAANHLAPETAPPLLWACAAIIMGVWTVIEQCAARETADAPAPAPSMARRSLPKWVGGFSGAAVLAAVLVQTFTPLTGATE